jgi:hypothetical protein
MVDLDFWSLVGLGVDVAYVTLLNDVFRWYSDANSWFYDGEKESSQFFTTINCVMWVGYIFIKCVTFSSP